MNSDSLQLQTHITNPEIAHTTASLFPVRRNGLLAIKRLAEHGGIYPEIKDPSIVVLPNGSLVMFASIGRSSDQQWIIGRFESRSPMGPWIEVAPVEFKNITGPELCAPAVTYRENNGRGEWIMYVQTSCFSEDGVIAKAVSLDGKTFFGESTPVIHRNMVPNTEYPVVGVYDVGFSEVTINNSKEECLLFSGYRRVGCGDIFMSYKNKITKLLSQEDVPFHNHPNSEHFEWGLEGAKIDQLNTNCFLMIGVCFLPKPREFLGTRQRVFFAASRTIEGPYYPLGIPLSPRSNPTGAGENGHPETIVKNGRLWIIYQERTGNGQPWHLRVTSYSKAVLAKAVSNWLNREHPVN